MNISHTGVLLSKHHRNKISLGKKGKLPKNIKLIAGWNKGKKMSKEVIEKNRNAQLGKKMSLEAREKMSLTQKKIGNKPPLHKGNNHWNWKGGITSENNKVRSSIELRLWREAVFARDNYTCQKYKIKGGKLHAHHILNFANNKELRLAIDNGVTLSDKAHREFHKKYGNKRNTPEQLKEFLTYKISK